MNEEKTNWLIGQKFLAEKDPILSSLIKRHGDCGLTAVTADLYFTALVKAIISQQLSQEAASTIFGRLKSVLPNETLTAKNISNLSLLDIKSQGLSTPKASYIINLSEKIISGEIVLEEFSTLSDIDIINKLTMIKGFGRWTAEMFLIFALNRTDVLPADDFVLKKSLGMHYGISMNAKRSEVAMLTDPWKPWRTLATYYLWKSYSSTKEKLKKIASCDCSKKCYN